MTVTIKDVRKIYDQWEEVYITKASFADKQDVKKFKDEKMGIVDVDQFIEQPPIPPISNSSRAKLPTMTATKREATCWPQNYCGNMSSCRCS